MLKTTIRFLNRNVRTYATKIAPNAPQKSKFDKSMVKPAVVVILFGSVLTNLMEEQKSMSEMERRYHLKIDILKDMINKVKVEGDSSIDIAEELKLVNKSFERFENSKLTDLEREAQRVRERADKNSYSKNSVINSLNSRLEDESLEDLFKEIMQDIDREGDILEPTMPSQSHVKQTKQSNAEDIVAKGDIVTNAKRLALEAEKEKRSLSFKPSTDAHVIVENPGDYSTAAEEQKVSKFL
ncbi:LAFE_0C13476g1_1 [Lachancea fermentati]|uniref:LAFE_0C13476g1_1 n=1 Tax=Lachancea fermentati TaxID=4955 RepID=A0A1G4MAQ5_LACFM|nr:LAFE_0C13476g1_1 [Lachancea fermentati]